MTEPNLDDKDAWYQWLGARIRNRRQELGLSQETVAAAVPGMARSSLSHVERGHRKLYATELRWLAPALQMTPGQLLDERDWCAPGREPNGHQRQIVAVYTAELDGMDLTTEVERDRRGNKILWVHTRGARLSPLGVASDTGARVYLLEKDE